MKSEKLSNNIIESMFLSSVAVMIATQIIGVVAIIIDGVITGWKLGMEAYLAISLIHPFVTIVLTLAGFISIGNQTRNLHPHLFVVLPRGGPEVSKSK